MSGKPEIAPVRVLPDDVANKIAAGEVVERPASVVKELVENSLDAGATRISVRIVAAGRQLIEVVDNGHGMSEQNALLAIERHATSKIRSAQDIESVLTMGFRGEALASIASVAQFALITRREKDAEGTRIAIDGGVLHGVERAGAPVGTRIVVKRLYFNTPVRAKFLKGITTELGHCIDVVQRHALAREGVGFQFFHNDKILLDIPEHARLRERVALIWGLNFVRDMEEIDLEHAGLRVRGLIGTPALTRGSRSHQFFFMNRRPVVNRALQYGFEEGYRGLLTIGRYPVGVLLLETHPRFVDINIHPTKRDIRFRDEQAIRGVMRDLVRQRLEELAPRPPERIVEETRLEPAETLPDLLTPIPMPAPEPPLSPTPAPANAPLPMPSVPPPMPVRQSSTETAVAVPASPTIDISIIPDAAYQKVGDLEEAPLQVFDTYLLVPAGERLLIIDQHALHERLNYDNLVQELSDGNYESQQLVVPLIIEVPPSHVRLVESNLDIFSKLGVELEHFGGNTFQITAICHFFEENRVPDMIYRVLDDLSQGDLFDKENYLGDLLRLATVACKASVKAGDRLTPEERRGLLEGFRQLRPPYTCPHGRPIIVELTQHQMEKSFRRIQ